MGKGCVGETDQRYLGKWGVGDRSEVPLVSGVWVRQIRGTLDKWGVGETDHRYPG